MPGNTHTSKMAGLILLFVFCIFFIVLGMGFMGSLFSFLVWGFMGFYYKKCTLLVPYMCVNRDKQSYYYIDNG